MGGAARKIKKAAKKVASFVDKKVVEPLEKPVKSVAKAVDKAVVEPLEKPVKSVAKVVDKAIVEPLEKPVKSVVKGVVNVAEEAFEELIEKPVKKVAAETFDVVMNTDKEERRAMLGDAPPPEPEVTPEITPEVVPDETILASKSRRRSPGKRSGQAGTLLEGYGSLYRKGSSKSPTGGA